MVEIANGKTHSILILGPTQWNDGWRLKESTWIVRILWQWLDWKCKAACSLLITISFTNTPLQLNAPFSNLTLHWGNFSYPPLVKLIYGIDGTRVPSTGTDDSWQYMSSPIGLMKCRSSSSTNMGNKAFLTKSRDRSSWITFHHTWKNHSSHRLRTTGPTDEA